MVAVAACFEVLVNHALNLTRIHRMARDFPAVLERFIYNDQCVMLD
jgi:hypothetical protein